MKKPLQVDLTSKERSLIAYAIYDCTDEFYGLKSQTEREIELNKILRKLHKLTTSQLANRRRAQQL